VHLLIRNLRAIRSIKCVIKYLFLPVWVRCTAKTIRNETGVILQFLIVLELMSV